MGYNKDKIRERKTERGILMMEKTYFEKGKRYFAYTKKHEVRFFDCTNVLKRKSTGERVFVVGSFDGKVEQRYEIHNSSDCEWINADNRYNMVVTSQEWRG